MASSAERPGLCFLTKKNSGGVGLHDNASIRNMTQKKHHHCWIDRESKQGIHLETLPSPAPKSCGPAIAHQTSPRHASLANEIMYVACHR